jgi:hypothetical protein
MTGATEGTSKSANKRVWKTGAVEINRNLVAEDDVRAFN